MTTETVTTSELDSLIHLAAAADQGAVVVDQPAGVDAEKAQPQGPNYALEAAGAVDMFAALVVGYAPKAESIWTDKKKAQIAAALAPVLEKYGVSMGNLPPELVLAVMAGPALFATIKVIARQRIDEAKEQQAEQRAQQPAQASQQKEEDGPGPAVHNQMSLYNR